MIRAKQQAAPHQKQSRRPAFHQCGREARCRARFGRLLDKSARLFNQRPGRDPTQALALAVEMGVASIESESLEASEERIAAELASEPASEPQL